MRMPSNQCRLLVVLATLVFSGCAKNYPGPIPLSGDFPAKGPIIPSTTVRLSDAVTMPLDKLIFYGAYAATAYLVLDPLSPNWEIEEAAFPENYYHFNLKMKRYYAGGAGEARVTFNSRAKELMRRGGFDGYTIIEYNEGLDSSVIGSQRVAQGVIQLTRKAG